MSDIMKPYLIIATLILASCGRNDNAATTTPRGPANSARAIEFWHIQTYDPTKPAVEEAVARCQSERPRLKITTQAIKNDAFKTKLKMDMGAGTEPDVFHTWGGGVLQSYVKYNLVMNLDPLLPAGSTDKFHPAALDFCRAGGNLYGLPVDVTVVPVWYNKAVFAKAGVAVPKTIDEFYAVCDTLRRQDVTPLALGNIKSWPGAFYFMYFATRAGGMEPIENGDYENPAFIEAGRQIQKMVKADYFNKGFNGIDYDEARRLFFRGESAMIVMGTWMLAHARKEAPELLNNIGCFAFPGMDNPEWNDIIVGGVNAGYAVAAYTKYPEDCIALLQALTDEQGMADWAATGRIPALNREAATPLLAPETLVAAEILFDAKAIQLYYDQYLPPALGTMHKETSQALFALTTTPEAAAAKMTATAKRRP